MHEELKISKGLTSDFVRDKKRGDLVHTESGIIVPTAKIAIGGVFGNSLNGDPFQYAGNLMTDEGLEDMLDVVFSDKTQINTHYIGLINNNGSIVAGDTYNSHTGWTESTTYDIPRKTWDEQGVSSKSITNTGGTPSTFTMGASPDSTIYGAALFGGVSTAGDTAGAGVLVAASLFGAARGSLIQNDQLTITYTLTIADA